VHWIETVRKQDTVLESTQQFPLFPIQVATLFKAIARMLRLRVRILPVTWMSVVSVVCCQIEISATG